LLSAQLRISQQSLFLAPFLLPHHLHCRRTIVSVITALHRLLATAIGGSDDPDRFVAGGLSEEFAGDSLCPLY